MYGHPPRHFGILDVTQCTVSDLQHWLSERLQMKELIKANLHRAQQRMKSQADKDRQERHFDVGDWVYLKLQPFIQQSVAQCSNRKLSFRYFGPYLVVQKVGVLAYKLQLPPSSQIHPVVRVSQLKRALPPSVTVSADTDLNCVTIAASCDPMQVLQTKLQKVGNKIVPFGRVQWTNLPADSTSWENLQTLPRHPSSG
jgi:hypothetical protein